MAKVCIVMGSANDWDIMSKACTVLDEYSVSYDRKVLSAHRTPLAMAQYAKEAEQNGANVIIAGAGMAAHLPGVFASLVTLPVIGVPIHTNTVGGLDSLLSIVQMPRGVPVATVAINNATNAALLAIQMMALSDKDLTAKLKKSREMAEAEIGKINEDFWNGK